MAQTTFYFIFNNRIKSSLKPVSLFISLSILLLFISAPSFSANRYWVGSGAANWNSTTNWSDVSGGAPGFSIPGASDIAVFDGGDITDCVIDTHIIVNGFVMSALYAGIISSNTGINMTVADSGFSQSGGTFTGNDGNISINGAFNLSGGTFTSSTATLQITGGYTYSGGTFNHNNGTVVFSTTQTITGNTSFYNIIFLSDGGTYTIAAGTTITSINNVTISGGFSCTINTGIVAIKGDLTLTANQNSSDNGGSATFLFDGTGTQNINSSASGLNHVCGLPNIMINKTSGVLNFSGIINFCGSSWNTVAGSSLINAGTSVVNVLSTATLSGENLSLYDLVITGNFSIVTISSGLIWTSTHTLTFAGAGSWYQVNTGTLNAKGDILVTNTNTSNNVGGNAVLLIDGTANQTLTGSGIAGGGRLPQVQINKTGGTLTLSADIISTDHNWTYIAGNVDANTNASTLDFYKTAVVDGQGTAGDMAFHHVIFSGLISLGGNMDVDGDLTISNGVNNGLDVTASNNYQLHVAGNWTNNNSITATSFNQQNGKVVFDGGSAQSLTLGLAGDIEFFYNLEIKNTGAGLTLNAPVTISNTINFVTGNIFSSASNILLLTNGATSTGESVLSFVSGPVSKTGNQAFLFPVGKNAVFAPIAMSAPALTTDQFMAEYFQADPDLLYETDNKAASLDHISRCEYWTLDRTAGAANVTVNLSWDTRSCGVTSLTDLRVARWNGTQWTDHGNGGTTGTNSSGTIVSAAAATAFSPFTLASVSTANPLPVELLHFSGECQGKNTVIEWITASETNNDYFTIERSTPDLNWMVIGTVDGAGNSNAIRNYAYTDTHQHTGISYYRLKQTDFNGDYKYFQIISVDDCSANLTETDLVIYPNPSSGTFRFSYSGDQEQIRTVSVYTMLGEQIYNSENGQAQIELSDKKPGIYNVHFNTGNDTIIKKIVIE